MMCRRKFHRRRRLEIVTLATVVVLAAGAAGCRQSEDPSSAALSSPATSPATSSTPSPRPGDRQTGAIASGEAPSSASSRSESAAADSSPASSPSAAAPRKEGPPGLLPQFELLSADSGLVFSRYDDFRGERRLIEANGGGAAMFDYDRDGVLDLYFTNGCRAPLRLDDGTTPGALFRQHGRLTFANRSAASRLLQQGYGTGVAAGDFDNDAFPDLYVTAFGPNRLWRNLGDGTFAPVEGPSLAVNSWSTSAAFGDVDVDGDLDLYVANYVIESDESPRLCPNPESPDGYEQCPPSQFDGADDVLLLSDGEGGFRDASAAAGLTGLKGKGLGVAIANFEGAGLPQIYVANDGEANFLLVPETPEPGDSPADEAPAAAGRLPQPLPPGEHRYSDRGLSAGVALNENGYAQASMGVAVGDCDADGRLDLFLTHFFNDTNTLYLNRGQLQFEDATRRSTLGPTSRAFLGFGAVFLDADNDGQLDLFVANGHIDDRSWVKHDEPYFMRPQFYRNRGQGVFEDVSIWCGDYFTREWLGRGVSLGDLDGDGGPDLVISHQRAPSAVLLNRTQTDARSLTLRFVGLASPRDGALVRVEIPGASPAVVRQLAGGGSYQSALAQEVHLGLAGRVSADVQVSWPSGAVQQLSGLTPGAWTVVEGRGALSR